MTGRVWISLRDGRAWNGERSNCGYRKKQKFAADELSRRCSI